MMQYYAVMGSPIAHSLSPWIHQAFADQTGLSISYATILADLDHFEAQVRDFFEAGGSGLNITLPCKERAYSMATERKPRCLRAKAANTLWMQEGQLCADNTDGIGLLRDIKRYTDVAEKTVVILGAGGAVRGILAPLLDAEPKRVVVVSRNVEKAQHLQADFPSLVCVGMDEIADVFGEMTLDILINAIPIQAYESGMVLPGGIQRAPSFCYDLAYQKQGDTPFVTWAKSLGCVAVDGFGMLVEQAAEAFYIWHGVLPDTRPLAKKRLDGISGR